MMSNNETCLAATAGGLECDGLSSLGAMLDEDSLASELSDVLERNGFPPYVSCVSARAAVEVAREMWNPCRSDGSCADGSD